MFSVVFGLLLIVAVKCQDVDDPDYYTAAVHEHVRKGNYKTDTTEEFIEKNLAAYERAATTAGQHNVDLLVFPEFGLFPPTEREVIIDDAQYVPDPKIEQWNPCLEPDRYNNSYILANLSCIAKQNNLVILANILSKVPCDNSTDCPDDKFYVYNTNVAFNRSGLLIARYRKTHLYFEDGLNVLPKPEFIVFSTDFALIGTFVCFDIVWKESVQMVEKYKPDAVIFSTLWFDFKELGMNAVQVQQSWGIANNVTIIAANRQRPDYGSLGSGMFFGDTGIGNYVYIADGQSRLLISKVPKRGVTPPQEFPPPIIIEFGDFAIGKSDNNISSGVCSRKILGSPSNYKDFRCQDYDLSNFTLVKVNAENHVEACNNGLCCSASYKVQLSDEDYYLAVFNGTYTAFERYTWWIEACFFVRCDSYKGKACSTFPTKASTVFEELKIEANFTTPYVYPSISISGLQLAPKKNWVYKNHKLHFKTESDSLLLATLFGRSYDRDPE
ncbi:biotinidase-like [Centruroides sculpturatus]|uniref:biotinidase-like n=1 Tax=Centruroides sculpturatus TaxID=218467 RepID=UPI000C6EF913|nr:biotinidase-like [Centruroides sculpturatus]